MITACSPDWKNIMVVDFSSSSTRPGAPLSSRDLDFQDDDSLHQSNTSPTYSQAFLLGLEEDIRRDDFSFACNPDRLHERPTSVEFLKICSFFDLKKTFTNRSADSKDGYLYCPAAPSAGSLVLAKAVESHVSNTFPPKDGATQTYLRRKLNKSTQSCLTFEGGDLDILLASSTVPSLARFLSEIYPTVSQVLDQNTTFDLFEDDFSTLSHEDILGERERDLHLKDSQSFTTSESAELLLVSDMKWHPTVPGMLATSTSGRLFSDHKVPEKLEISRRSRGVSFWTFSDPLRPILILESPDDINCFEFHPTNVLIVIGGSVQGRVLVWDLASASNIFDTSQDLKRPEISEPVNHKLSSASDFLENDYDRRPLRLQPVALSNVDMQHRSIVTSLGFFPAYLDVSRSGHVRESELSEVHQFCSSSNDGAVMIWDLATIVGTNSTSSSSQAGSQPSRQGSLDSTFKPLVQLFIGNLRGHGNAHARRVLPAATPRGDGHVPVSDETAVILANLCEQGSGHQERQNQLIVTTECGQCLHAEIKVYRDPETGTPGASSPLHGWEAHEGPCLSLDVGLSRPRLFLTVGGWDFCLWVDDFSQGPVYRCTRSPHPLTYGVLSQTRAGVIFVASSSGAVAVWNLADRTHEPVLVQQISTTSITSLALQSPHNRHQYLAVGDRTGRIHVLDVPWRLRHVQPEHDALFYRFLTKEISRRTGRYSTIGTTVEGPASMSLAGTANSLTSQSTTIMDSRLFFEQYLSFVKLLHSSKP